jgi:predicted metal-dependent phosphoesterase TrpH
MSLDLHIHSTFSDGTLSPAEIVNLASRKGLTAIALTDHDTMAGIKPAIAAATGMALEVIPGLEISVLHNGISLHILGYLMDSADPGLNRVLTSLQEGRDERNAAIVKRLLELGIAVSPEDLRRVSQTGQTGRPHIAKVMVEQGIVRTILQAFEQYLGRGGLAYASRPILDAAEAIGVLRQAGGLAVLAHPLQVDPSLEKLPGLLDDLVPLGLDGLEGYYPTHSAKVRRKLRAAAERYGLVLTGGSDFHGDIRPGTTIAGGRNVQVPDELLGLMKERADSR